MIKKQTSIYACFGFTTSFILSIMNRMDRMTLCFVVLFVVVVIIAWVCTYHPLRGR